MLTRIMSAVVAIILGAVVIALHNTFVLPLAIALISGLMLYELLHATDSLKFKSTISIAFIYILISPFYIYNSFGKYGQIIKISLVILMFATFIFNHKELSYQKLAFIIISTVLVSYSMLSLLIIERNNEHGVFCMVLALCGAWLADTGAYFAGTFFGKNKLCPEISPKKTVEGLIGGTVFTVICFVLIALIFSLFKDTADPDYLMLVLLAIICSVLGLVGDLTASLIKRQNNIKDYGNIMPGHGGAMDRFDSVLFVAPFMCAFLNHVTII